MGNYLLQEKRTSTLLTLYQNNDIVSKNKEAEGGKGAGKAVSTDVLVS